VISTELVAEVEGTQIVAWREGSGTHIRNVGPDGELEPLDFRPAAAVSGALLADAMVSAPGVVGINRRLVERRRAKEQRTIPAHLHEAARARAETQILDRLNGSAAVGVRLYLIPPDDAGDRR
jgi:hypothetical protein